MERTDITSGLRLLGEVLAEKGRTVDLLVAGGATLVLLGLVERATADIDAISRLDANGRWQSAKPFPDFLVEAVREVAAILDLPSEARKDEKDWLNPGPAFLGDLGLPEGFEHRVERREFGALTLHLLGRRDLIALKLWAATSASRGARRDDDLQDLRQIEPTAAEFRAALDWCCRKDGRADFAELDAAPILERLGTSLAEVLRG